MGRIKKPSRANKSNTIIAPKAPQRGDYTVVGFMPPNANQVKLSASIKSITGKAKGNVNYPIEYLYPTAKTPLTHGTDVEHFTEKMGRKDERVGAPRSPAWFGIKNTPFSLHAGVRRINSSDMQGSIYLHKYKLNLRAPLVSKRLKLHPFKDFKSLSKFIFTKSNKKFSYNSKDAAKCVESIFENDKKVYDGYSLEKDEVRGEKEVILFDTGLSKIERTVKRKWNYKGKMIKWGASKKHTHPGQVLSKNSNNSREFVRFEGMPLAKSFYEIGSNP